MHAVFDVIENRAVLDSLRRALASGGPVQSGETLDTSAVEIDALDKAIACAGAARHQSAAVRSVVKPVHASHFHALQVQVLLTFAVQRVRPVRFALRSDNWTEVERLSLLGRAQPSDAAAGVTTVFASGGPTVSAEQVPIGCVEELAAVDEEVDNRRVCAALQSALSTGTAGGQPGSLDASHADARGVDAAIELARALGVRTQAASTLFSSAMVVSRLRRALAAGSWGDVAAVARAASAQNPQMLCASAEAEVNAAIGEHEHRCVVAALTAELGRGCIQVLVEGDVVTSSIDADALAAAVTHARDVILVAPSAVALRTAAKCIVRLRAEVKRRSWSDVSDALDALAAPAPGGIGCVLGEMPAVAVEVAAARTVLADSVLCARLETALAGAGGLHGPPDAPDVSGVATWPLQQVLAECVRAGVDGRRTRSRRAMALAGAAAILLELRETVRGLRWEETRAVLEKCEGGALDTDARSLVTAELRAVRSVLDHRDVVGALRSALAAAGPSTAALDRAIALAASRSVESEELSSLAETARVLSRARSAASSGNWHIVASMLGSVSVSAGGGVPASGAVVFDALARCELDALRADADNRLCAADLRAALGVGFAVGSPGTLDTSTVSLIALDVSLRRAHSVTERGPELTLLVHTAQVVADARTELRVGDWAAVAAVLATASVTDDSGRSAGIDECACRELGAMFVEVSNLAACRELRTALGSGQVRAENGAYAADGARTGAGVRLEELEASVASAGALRVRTAECRDLARAADCMLHLRSLVRAADWAGVRALADRTDVSGEGGETMKDELRVIAREASERCATDSLKACLRA